MDKRLVAISLIAITSLIITVVALSASRIPLYPTTTPLPTVTPTATPNLSSAIPDTPNNISISITAINHAHFPRQWMPSYYVHITNNGASSITAVSIIGTAIDDQTNFTYWSGNQDIAPNTTENFTANNSYYAEWPMQDIYVYYEVSRQLFVHSLAPAPIPYNP